MPSRSSRPPLVLIVLDGFGISPIEESNPMYLAKRPFMNDLIAHYPYGALDASGIAVGLPWGEVGNSEVGHLNLGAGLVVYQNLPRINMSIENKSFLQNEAFRKAAEHVVKNKSHLHFLGITSTGGVHGHINHLKALLQFCKEKKLKDVSIHCITDGRDSAPQAGLNELKELQKLMKKLRVGQIASLCGRFYAMDRNNTWDRTQKSYDLLTLGKGTPFHDPLEALRKSYEAKVDDEMLEPVIITNRKNAPLATVNDNDAVIFFNFREDRARQIAQSFVLDAFDGFTREKRPSNLVFVTMTEYEAGLEATVAFPPQHIKEPFGALIANEGYKQLRIAETEKYAHVTYFFNGGQEEIYKGEDRILVPSPKVRTYDMKPEMSAYQVAEKLVAEIAKKKYDFCLVNFANPDMVGHTGNLEATIKALQATDECVSKVVEANKKVGGITAVTADHGNAESKVDLMTHRSVKEHSTSPVPFILVDEEQRRDRQEAEVEFLKKNVNPIGILADVAPTLLERINLKPSPDMTGRSLLKDLM
ncbi:2,3-bisphosphoglycerate-independent phosphoglycerate mutase [Candidatus Uhrbacteria bacterium]|nr:2,3-bisphosphoglycerate-independent phosphoglycerate mutase [Candidatus Uhrbacteria bacterium]